ncbi:ATP-binding protein [Flavobacterium sp.]|uniref:ATP-binding protein n=1 Tax=Flavobacterium sp. TaxID=239 RepID=UPI002B4B812B|nr:ATP-binding protein [Flavobacterium sp.]HLP63437.1 ATP-binding protein [Flavobacterium sp.]
MSNFTFNISLSVLNHLGRNLYRNFITVLGEAISNSWDADAKNVWIHIDKLNNSLIIKDDGIGMTSDDFQTKFLKIGYSKRKEGVTTTSKNRPFIGRKGIGKLALLSCAKRIHIITKTRDSEFVGGIIDNSALDNAINDDLTPQQYPLENVKLDIFNLLKKDLESGTIIYFEDINDGIRNRIEYIRKLIALFFRFSLIDNSFSIHLNDDTITLNELNELSLSTQFVWQINNLDDPYLKDKISATNEHIKQYKKISSAIPISGFIASVEKPSHLKIKQTSETVTVDLYVNGRLREKDLLKHIPSTRIFESYLYGQIHYNNLDSEKDRFTSSREGVISDDPLFQTFLEELKDNILKQIMDDWDKWRIEINQDGDSENTTRLTKKERKSKELFNTVIDEFVPPKESKNRDAVDEWAKALSDDAQFNLSAYAECFVSENLLRKFIKHKSIALSPEASTSLVGYKKKEQDAKNAANISYEIRQNADDLLYFSMDDLTNLVDKPINPTKEAALARDAKTYKPIRDAMAHTSILTSTAKQSLNVTYENIKARIKKLIE